MYWRRFLLVTALCFWAWVSYNIGIMWSRGIALHDYVVITRTAPPL